MSLTDICWTDSDATPHRIADLFGLPGARNYRDIDLAIHVHGGLPLISLSTISRMVGDDAAARHFPLAHRDRACGEVRNMTPVESNRLYCLARIIDRMMRRCGMDAREVRDYLTTPHPRLNNIAPIAIATMNSAGAAVIERLVEQGA